MAAKGFLVTPKGDVSEVILQGGFKMIQEYVGGHFEIFPHPQGWDADVVAYVNEEGILGNLPPNPKAREIMCELGYEKYMPHYGVLGPVVIVGQKNGKETILSEKKIEIIQKYVEISLK